MTMNEIEHRTPNGLHDAYLLGVTIDYKSGQATLDLELFVGSPNGRSEEEREKYRPAKLFIQGIEYFVIEAPAGGAGLMSGTSSIDGFLTREEDIIRCTLPPVEEGTFRYSIFVEQWNSFIHFAGHDAEISPNDVIVKTTKRDLNAI